MSSTLISHNEDLKRLRDEGYAVSIQSGYLLVADVPYVNTSAEIKRGTLVSTLSLNGNSTNAPDTHVAMFIGDYPCDQDGAPLEKIKSGDAQRLTDELTVNYSFSSKPSAGYKDYHEKMTAYVAILESQAQALNPDITAKTHPPFAIGDEDSVFHYVDTATSRAKLGVVNDKLKLSKVAIVGLGGTGSYVFDLVAKTPVWEIHLFDGDDFSSHNVFRAPGAASLEQLEAKPTKVQHLHDEYSTMRKGIIVHEYALDETNVGELEGMDFVFLCVDEGSAKRVIVEQLETLDIPFVDVGMGVDRTDDALGGIVRATLSLPGRREHFRDRVSLGDVDAENEYDENIQIADLNALNAAMAVIRWKKLFGFYRDLADTLHGSYTIDTDSLLSEDGPDEA